MNNLFSLHSALSADIADEVRASSFTKFLVFPFITKF